MGRERGSGAAITVDFYSPFLGLGQGGLGWSESAGLGESFPSSLPLPLWAGAGADLDGGKSADLGKSSPRSLSPPFLFR